MSDAETTARARARRADVERFVYGGLGGPRFTQRSPIMPDVWIRFALEGPGPQELLLVAKHDSTAGRVAGLLANRLCADAPDERSGDELVAAAGIVATQAAIAARLTFGQLLRAALSATTFWKKYLTARVTRPGDGPDGRPKVEVVDPATLFSDASPIPRDVMIAAVEGPAAGEGSAAAGQPRYALPDDLRWLIRVAGGIAHLHTLARRGRPTDRQWARWLEERERGKIVVDALFALLGGVARAEDDAPLWAIHGDRRAEMAIRLSMSTIKADAARHVFDVTGKGVVWAVVDSGIDAEHRAFRRRDGDTPRELPREGSWAAHSRVTCTYDFTHVRELMALTPAQVAAYEAHPEGVPEVLRERLKDAAYRAELHRVLVAMTPPRKSAERPVVDWKQWRPLLRVEHVAGRYRKPEHPHGTHVAGILAADWRVDDSSEDEVAPEDDVPARQVARTGVCPELELWDLRVLDAAGESREFSILAALQLVRAVNAEHEHQEIHGVNLSLSLLHDVELHACGGTPICVECDRLVGSGVVVVTAAGNNGRARYTGVDGAADEGYRTASITDPGNAHEVITVGAAHREAPHRYGVSYFSSRGPTGDGRAKPDLVAPGEKITSTAPGDAEICLGGTSAAAPHVSGAAALLLCRYAELRGRPAEVKRILCATATDLGRDRYCQGAGLVDILRALESI